MKDHYKVTLVIHVIITLAFNWTGLTFGEAVELYDDREWSFWLTILLTFPLMISSALVFYWVVASVRYEIDIRPVGHTIMVLLLFYGTTWLLDGLALIPIDFEMNWDYEWRYVAFINLIALTNAYWEAYQPLNFVLAVVTGVYWAWVFLRRLDGHKDDFT